MFAQVDQKVEGSGMCTNYRGNMVELSRRSIK